MTGGARHEYDKFFTEHALFGELTLARKIEDKDPDSPQAIEMLSLEINPKYDESVFQKPERAVPPPPNPYTSDTQIYLREAMTVPID